MKPPECARQRPNGEPSDRMKTVFLRSVFKFGRKKLNHKFYVEMYVYF